MYTIYAWVISSVIAAGRLVFLEVAQHQLVIIGNDEDIWHIMTVKDTVQLVKKNTNWGNSQEIEQLQALSLLLINTICVEESLDQGAQFIELVVSYTLSHTCHFYCSFVWNSRSHPPKQLMIHCNSNQIHRSYFVHWIDCAHGLQMLYYSIQSAQAY